MVEPLTFKTNMEKPSVGTNPTLSFAAPSYEEDMERIEALRKQRDKQEEQTARAEFQASRVENEEGWNPKDPTFEWTPESIVEEWGNMQVASHRGLVQGAANLLDLVPTALNWVAEGAANYITGGEHDFDDIIRPWALTDAASESLGSRDVYTQTPTQEIAYDVGNAVPLMASLSASLARYGAAQIAKAGTVSPMFAQYTGQLGTSLGLDMAAITMGETAEELVEELGAEEDGLLATAANIGTAVFGSYRLASKYMSQETVEQGVEAMGGTIKETGGMVEGVTKVANAVTKPLDAGVAAVKKIPDGVALFLDKAPLSRMVFKEFREQGGSFRKLLSESRALDKNARGYFKSVMDKMGPEDTLKYKQNLELSAALDLELDTFALTGREEFRSFSLAVAKLDPVAYLQTQERNLKKLDAFLTKEGTNFNPASRNRLKTALGMNEAETDAYIEGLKKTMQQQRESFVKSSIKDPALTGEQFQAAFVEYKSKLQDIVASGYKKVLKGKMPATQFNMDVVEGLRNLDVQGLLPKKDVLPKDIKRLLEATGEVKELDVADVHQTLIDLRKARKKINKTDPLYYQKDIMMSNVIDSMEDSLVRSLPKNAQTKYAETKQAWREQIGDRFNPQEVKKFKAKDIGNQLLHNGEELIQEILTTAPDSATRVEKLAKLLQVSYDDMTKLAGRLDLSDMRSINGLFDAQQAMHLKIKDYVSRDFMVKLLKHPERSVDEVASEYLAQHGRAIESVLQEPLDIPKMAREVQAASAHTEAQIERFIANKLDLGLTKGGNFNLETYLDGTLLNNPQEIKKFMKLMDDPERMAKLGLNKDEVLDTLAGKMVAKHVNHDYNGIPQSSNLFRTLQKNRETAVQLLGEKRVAHMESFDRGFDLATKHGKGPIDKTAADLERGALPGMLQHVPRLMSQQLAVARNFVSRRYIIALNTTRILGGLKNDSYKKFVTKMMTDPEFFQSTVEMASQVKKHDDIIRLRLVLAAQGVPTDTKNEQEGTEAARNLMDVSIAIEDSLWKGKTLEEVKSEDPYWYTEDDLTVMKDDGKLTDDDITYMRGQVIGGNE